jgi:hypothetical protein
VSTANVTRSLRKSIPYYEQNRDRTAVVLQKGFDAYDRYLVLQPWIFGASLIGLAASSWLWYKRRNVREAHAVYPVTTVACAATAWLTRPRIVPEQAVAEAAATGAPAPSPVIVYLDTEVAKAKRKDPYFADKVFQRLVSTPAVQPTWQGTPSYLQALVI